LISYTELYRPVRLRREALLAKKNFWCRCRRCVGESISGSGCRIDGFACPTKGCRGHVVVTGPAALCVLCGVMRSETADQLARLQRELGEARERAAALLAEGAYDKCVATVERALKKCGSAFDPLHHERFELSVLAVDALGLVQPPRPETLLPHALGAAAAMRIVYGVPTVHPRMIRVLGHIATAYDELASSAHVDGAARAMLEARASAARAEAIASATTICGASSATTESCKHSSRSL